MTTLASLVLAHQGGWDETLLVLAPIAVIAGLVQIVRRRADRALEARTNAPAGESAASAPAAPGQSAERSIVAPSERNFPTKSS